MKQIRSKLQFLLLLSFCLQFNLSYSQERISAILNEGYAQRQILKEYNGENYILSINSYDSIQVYSYLNGESTYLHGKRYPGIYQEINFKTTDQFLLFKNINGSIAYNFITNQETIFPYSVGNVETLWAIAQYKDEVVLTQYPHNNVPDREQWLINLATGEETSIDNRFSVREITEHYLLLYDNSDFDNTSWHIYNKENGSTQLIINEAYISHFFNDNMFVYVLENKLKKYDNITGVNEDLVEFEDDVESIKLLNSENHLIVSYEKGINKPMITIDIETLEQQFSDPNITIDRVSKVEAFDKMIICGSFSCKIHDFQTNNSLYFDNALDDLSTEIISERYLFVVDQDISYKLLDLENNAKYDLNQAYQNASILSASFINDNDKLLINFDHFTRDWIDLWEIDLNSISMVDAREFIPSLTMGITDDGHFVKAKDDLILIDKNIFHISENNIQQINNFPLVEAGFSTYNLINDNLYWLENINESVTLCTFIDGARNEIVVFPDLLPLSNFQTTDPYSVDENYVYTSLSNDLIRINKSDGSIDILSLDFLVSNFNLFTHNEYTYIKNEQLQYVNNIGELIDIDINLDNLGGNIFHLYNNQLFIISQEEIYLLQDSTTQQVFEISDFGGLLTFNKDYVISNSWADEFYYSKDGINWVPGNFDGSYQYSIKENYIVIADSNNTVDLYNLESETTINIPDEYQNLRFKTAFSHFDKTLLIASQNINGPKDEQLFEIIDQTIVEQNNYNVSYRATNNETIQLDSISLILSGDKVLTLDQNLEIKDLNNSIKGDNNANVIVGENHVYFTAISSSFDRQVYVLSKSSLPVYNIDIPLSYTELSIYPNPTNSSINLNSEMLNGTARYSINSMDGRLVKSGQTNGNIDVGTLIEGAYMIILEHTQGELEIAHFIKH